MSEKSTDTDKSSTTKCHKCGLPIEATDDQYRYSNEVYFHAKCFNRYEHYYGLDKPLD